MAGIYLHIPFCKQACYYCDFHFSTYHKLLEPVIAAMHRELELRKNYLGEEKIDTIYFGGGTPSLLDAGEITAFLEKIFDKFDVDERPEITLEANPDDLKPEKLEMLAGTGINRLSIGVQSFNDEVLDYLNRTHTGQEAIKAIHFARDKGFTNINIDLIHGIFSHHLPVLKKDLKKISELNPEHISIYTLTIEENTVFGRWLKNNRISDVHDEITGREYEYIMRSLTSMGYDHYETSNFAKPGFISRHNSNYWRQVTYLGIGPSAHSFNGRLREHNINNNSLYIKSIQRSKIPADYDYLKPATRINEIIMTSLRTKWGIDIRKLHQEYNIDIIHENKEYIDQLVLNDMAVIENGCLKLKNKGKLMADKIAGDLFLD